MYQIIHYLNFWHATTAKMPPIFESKLSLSRNKNGSGIESPEEPNLEDITTAGSLSEDGSNDESETEDKTLKQYTLSTA